jgi:hypothetical protein
LRAIQSLALTLACGRAKIDRLDAFRKKRNISDYERAGSVSDQEAAEMFELALELRDELLSWLRSAHSELLSDA